MSSISVVQVVILVVVVAVFVSTAVPVDAMCMPEHPQTAVCRAHFVIKARIIEEEHHVQHSGNCSHGKESGNPSSSSSDDDLFKPKHIRVLLLKKFKGFNNKSLHEIVSIEIGSPWGPKLKQGKNYLLTGYDYEGKSLMTMCNWYSLWKDLTYVQKLSIGRYYFKYCHCAIKFCPEGGCPVKANHCAWTPYQEEIGDTRMDCQSKFGICMSNGKSCSFYSPKFKYACKNGPSFP